MSGRVIGDSTSLIVDSINKIGGLTQDFIYSFDLNSNDYDNVAAISATIPKTYYMSDSGRNDNRLLVEEGLMHYNVILPNGNYSIPLFITILTNLLDAGSVSVGNNFMYTITYPDSTITPQTNKFTYTVSNNSGVQPTFIFQAGQTSIAKFMGFPVNSLNFFIADSLISQYSINFQTTQFITIRSNICKEPFTYDGTTSILLRVPACETPYNSIIQFNMLDFNEASKIFVNSGSNRFVFSMYNDDGVLLDLNGSNYQLKILLYKYNVESNYVINDLKLKYLNESKLSPEQRDLEEEVGHNEANALNAIV